MPKKTVYSKMRDMEKVHKIYVHELGASNRATINEISSRSGFSHPYTEKLMNELAIRGHVSKRYYDENIPRLF